VVAEILQKYGITKTVIDPVIISTTGSKLLSESAANAIREKLFPLALILTPNIPEAIQFLPGHQPLNSLDGLISAAKALGGMGPKNILLKGGHLPFRRTEGGYAPAGKEEKEIMIDVFWDGNNLALIESPYVNTKNTHGTGCALACITHPPLLYPHFCTSIIKKNRSGNRIKPRSRNGGPRSSPSRLQLCLCRNILCIYTRKRAWAYQSLAQQLYHAFRPVRFSPHIPIQY